MGQRIDKFAFFWNSWKTRNDFLIYYEESKQKSQCKIAYSYKIDTYNFLSAQIKNTFQKPYFQCTIGYETHKSDKLIIKSKANLQGKISTIWKYWMTKQIQLLVGLQVNIATYKIQGFGLKFNINI
eukprot:TRINITY_DN32098_c0_g1_i1.p2 TRINITY_DN32098_c0_g1~~TRINITY_DN32098_c0_g1_i1.p2  ORF type:complete len:126 (-),score=15.89 TRINITY_DN32098_c0_g1_i1:62-439(-)